MSNAPSCKYPKKYVNRIFNYEAGVVAGFHKSIINFKIAYPPCTFI